MNGPKSESIECIIENQAFSLRYDLAPPPRLTPLLRQKVVFLSQYFYATPVELTDRRGEGVGEELNDTTARKPGPL